VGLVVGDGQRGENVRAIRRRLGEAVLVAGFLRSGWCSWAALNRSAVFS
jgi:hypothetical protein